MKTFSITDYGAVADGETDCTPALRRAWAAALREGRRQARSSNGPTAPAAQQPSQGLTGHKTSDEAPAS